MRARDANRMHADQSNRWALSETVSLFLGLGVLALAAALGLWSVDPGTVLDWALGMLGPGFLAFLGALLLGALYCLVRLRQAKAEPARAVFWYSAGLQCANGISTLALTYTLFGISVGIGALAGQGLTPETVESVIRDLTASFSLAFMTTVIGLPISALVRGWLVVAYAGQRADTARRTATEET